MAWVMAVMTAMLVQKTGSRAGDLARVSCVGKCDGPVRFEG